MRTTIDLLEVIHAKWAMLRSSDVIEICGMLHEVGAVNVCYYEGQVVRTKTLEPVVDAYIVEFDVPRFIWLLIAGQFQLSDVKGYWM